MRMKTLITIATIVLALASCTSPQKTEKLLVKEVVTTTEGKRNVVYAYDAENRLCKIYEEGMLEKTMNYEGNELVSMVMRVLYVDSSEDNSRKIMYITFDRLSADTIKADFYYVDSVKGMAPNYEASKLKPLQSLMEILDTKGQLVKAEGKDGTLVRFEYDSNDNMLLLVNDFSEHEDAQARTTSAELSFKYDDKVNPLQHRMPTWAYYTIDRHGGKNNVIESSIKNQFEDNEPNINTFKYTYNEDGTPAKMERSNGEVREYIYE